VSETPPKCIYCSVELDETTKWAHVIPESLGGRLKSKKICCSDCNRALGELEDGLFKELTPGLALLGCLTGDGREVVQTVEVDGKRHSHRKGRLVRPEDRPWFDRERQALITPLPAGLKNQARLIAQQIWNAGKTPDQVRFELMDEPNPLPASLGHRDIHYSMNVGGDKSHRRVFAKMAMELLAIRRPGAVFCTPLWKARRFARYGEGDFGYKADPHSPGSGLTSGVSVPTAANMVEVWSSGSHLLSRVGLLGQMTLTVSLSENWSGGKLALLYAANPVEPAKGVSADGDADGPPLAVWHEDMKAAAEQRFDQHFHAVAAEVAASDTTPIEREKGPSDEELNAAIRVAYDAIVAKKGAAKPRKPKGQSPEESG
jgi:hypothetical protein